MTDEARAELRTLRIASQRLVQNLVSGDYATAFKGSGLEFSQLRDYCQGDDVRYIDWNASAKMDRLMLKEFVQERDRTIILAVDCSSSWRCGSKEELKRERILRVTSALAYIAQSSNDRVGALLFSDKIEQWFAPTRGSVHCARILEQLCSFPQTGAKTDLAAALRFLLGLQRKSAILFIISDWIDERPEVYERLLSMVACEYDAIAVRVLDATERSLPDVGIVALRCPESGAMIWIDSHDKQVREQVAIRCLAQSEQFSKSGLDVLDLVPGEPLVRVLAEFLHRRIRRQV